MFKTLSKLEENHFEGQKNITKGSENGKDNRLAVILGKLLTNANLVALTSDAGGGGAAVEDDNPVTGLLATDLILSVSQRVPGATNLPLLGYLDQKDGSLDFTYSANPGAGAIVEVLVLRALT